MISRAFDSRLTFDFSVFVLNASTTFSPPVSFSLRAELPASHLFLTFIPLFERHGHRQRLGLRARNTSAIHRRVERISRLHVVVDDDNDEMRDALDLLDDKLQIGRLGDCHRFIRTDKDFVSYLEPVAVSNRFSPI